VAEVRPAGTAPAVCGAGDVAAVLADSAGEGFGVRVALGFGEVLGCCPQVARRMVRPKIGKRRIGLAAVVRRAT